MTVFVNTVDEATVSICNVPVVVSLNTIVPGVTPSVSFAANVPAVAFVPTTLA